MMQKKTDSVKLRYNSWDNLYDQKSKQNIIRGKIVGKKLIKLSMSRVQSGNQIQVGKVVS